MSYAFIHRFFPINPLCMKILGWKRNELSHTRFKSGVLSGPEIVDFITTERELNMSV